MAAILSGLQCVEQLETPEDDYVSIVAADDLVLKHQGICSHNTPYLLSQSHSINTLQLIWAHQRSEVRAYAKGNFF